MNYQSILGRIKDRDITLEEITRMDLDSKTKAILLYAYYEGNKMSYNIKLLLSQEFWTDDEEMFDLKNKLAKRSKQNNKLFEVGYFMNLIIGSRTVNSTSSLMQNNQEMATSETNAYNDLIEQIVQLMNDGKLNEALTLCEMTEFCDDEQVIIQHVKTLIALDRLDEALALIQQYRFRGSKSLKNLVAKIRRIKMDIDSSITEVKNFNNFIDYNNWYSLVCKVRLLIDQQGATRSIVEYLDFLLQVNVRGSRYCHREYINNVLRIRDLRDNFVNRLRKSAGEEPDSGEVAQHTLKRES